MNIDSCRDVVVENIYINNSDDGVCMKSGLDGFGARISRPHGEAIAGPVLLRQPRVCCMFTTYSSRSPRISASPAMKVHAAAHLAPSNMMALITSDCVKMVSSPT